MAGEGVGCHAGPEGGLGHLSRNCLFPGSEEALLFLSTQKAPITPHTPDLQEASLALTDRQVSFLCVPGRSSTFLTEPMKVDWALTVSQQHPTHSLEFSRWILHPRGRCCHYPKAQRS